jgi:KDO2-lipid IV(A) lauroyltransferase
LARASLRESGKAIAEAGALWLWHGARVLSLVKEAQGFDALKAVLAQGRGAILASPHLGAWEVIGLYCSSLGVPITSLYRPPRIAELGPIMRRGREALGARLVPADQSGVRALMGALRAGQLVGVLPDQDPGRDHGIFAPFFGIEANTMTLLSRLAQKTGAPVFLVYAERLAGGTGYRVVCRRCSSAINTGTLEESSAALNAAVETAIRAVPAQYLWSYKRFKTRPARNERFY